MKKSLAILIILAALSLSAFAATFDIAITIPPAINTTAVLSAIDRQNVLSSGNATVGNVTPTEPITAGGTGVIPAETITVTLAPS
jgi:hypothetical protein